VWRLTRRFKRVTVRSTPPFISCHLTPRLLPSLGDYRFNSMLTPCSYNWPCNVHGRAGKRKGPWLGRHRCTWGPIRSYLLLGMNEVLTYSAALIMRVSDMPKGHLRMQVRYDWPTCMVDAGSNPFGRERAVRCVWKGRSTRSQIRLDIEMESITRL
jgi:hypothetical protein